MTEKFPNLKREMNIQTHEAQVGEVFKNIDGAKGNFTERLQ